VACALGLKGQNVAFMVGLATAVAAAANFPALFLAVYWRGYTYAGAVAGMVAGLALSMVLLAMSPTVQVDILHHASAPFPLRNPGIVSIPLAFLVNIVVSLISRNRASASARYAGLEAGIFCGEGATEHEH
ncbi:sodium:solute symporter family transporter, partial [Burkholderia cenocepacia]